MGLAPSTELELGLPVVSPELLRGLGRLLRYRFGMGSHEFGRFVQQIHFSQRTDFNSDTTC